MIEFEKESSVHKPLARIKVLGVGGAGGNTINTMIDSQTEGLDFLVANTDAQTLKLAKTANRIQLGTKSTKGLGAGANPEVGRRAAEEDLSRIIETLDDSDVVFLTGGLGGGTGSGALPVIARALKERNILSIAVVTKPFAFEGKRRMKVAEEALESLKREVDTIVVIPNQKLLDLEQEDISLVNAFGVINEMINQCVKSISDIIVKPGHINVDFADVRTTMKDSGVAVMGTGKGTGPDRAYQAVQQALFSPLLENLKIDQARGVLLNITGNSSLGLHEVSKAASLVYDSVHEDANIIFGSVIDESMGDTVMVTVVATGFSPRIAPAQQPQDYRHTQPQADHLVYTKQVQSTQHINQPFSMHTTTTQQEELKDIDAHDLEVPALVRRAAQRMQSQTTL